MTKGPLDDRRARARDISEAVAAYFLTLDNMLTARKYFQGERTEHPGLYAWGNIIERAAARQREREGQQQRGQEQSDAPAP
ncbi:hypothetical protein [Actinomadura roseirufa]|uniref:hypothetical protein n=1 Tax=Actinomadura roseirufa TaxID=2094049 RepID=UPI00104159D1|nr:hypothetical protein [Actinomadura roseirufa]